MEPPRCPITQDFMHDPVMAADGQTYERAAILQWFQNHNTSPYTGAILTSKALTPNWAIKQMMEAYFNPSVVASSTVSSTASSAVSASSVVPATAVAKPTEPMQEINVIQKIFTYDTMKYLGIELICGLPSVIATNRKPVIIIGVIDVSGSMGERATPFNPDGENDGFSRLDLVKHSIATIQKSMQPGDRLAIIAFSSEARLVLDITEVSTNDRLITSRIDSLAPGGTTNIWAGLKMAIDLANRQDNKRYNTSIMLLTDGVANINPPRGTLPTFETYFKPMQGKFSIHTFAYGYEVDSALVSQIAAMSQGIFGYIPDGTMVGTVFINTMSSILSTVYNDVVIELKRRRTDTSQVEKIYLGSILYGQPRTLIIPYDSVIGAPEYFNLCYNNGFYSIEQCSTAREIATPLSGISGISDSYIINMIVKAALTKFLYYCASLTNYTHDAVSRLETFVSKFATYSSDDNPFIRDVITDSCDADPNKGQIGKSIANQQWFSKWGQHYLKSIASAYRQEWCLNFKDLGPQHFTSSTFASFREKIESIFLGITPPVPSIVIRTQAAAASYQGSASVVSPTYASIPQSYYDQSGGCFTGNWYVMLANGKTKLVEDISPGDSVISNDSPTGRATITHIIRLGINEPIQMYSPDGKVGLTSYHPFWKTNINLIRDWEFPMQTPSKHSFYINTGEYMYDFIIDQGFSVALEGGYNVACLGHGCQDSPIIAHEYFGNQRIIDDLKDHEDWGTGYITLDEWRFVRNSKGLVCKLEW